MRTSRIAVAAVTTGLLGLGVVVAPIALAADDADPGQSQTACDGTARRDGTGMPNGYGGGFGDRAQRGMRGGMGAGMGQGMGGGFTTLLEDAEKGTLTADQQAQLAEQAELEKLSHDVYVALAESSGDVRFDHIATAETRHLDAVRTLLGSYGVDDPTEGQEAGAFRTKSVADAYTSYVAEGSTSLEAALAVGEEIERDDIAGLEKADDGLDAPDVELAYEHLLRSSQMHLAAFGR